MKTKAVLIVTFVVLSCLRSSAQDLKLPTGLFLATAASDWTSTAYCTSNPHCGEANPMFAWAQRPLGVGGMVAIGGAADVLVAYGLNHLGHRHPRIAKTILYAGSALRVGLAVNNTRIGTMVRGWPNAVPTCPPGMFCRQ